MLMPSKTRVFLASGVTDMRKSINGLSILIEKQFELDPFCGHLFVFCNRRRNIVKIIFWDRNGFSVWMKRLEKHRLIWPESRDAVHEIDEADKTCDCGARLSRIGEDVREKLDYIPARVRVIRLIRFKYACKSCEGVDSDGPTIKIAPPPVRLIPKSIATPGLLAHIMVSEFEDALPFYRQTKIFSRLGVDLNRATMSNWAVKVSEYAQPLLPYLENLLRSGPMIGIDETTVQVMKESGRSKPVVLYQYHPTRKGKVPLDFLKDYQGYIQTDGYKGYDELGHRKGITQVGCMSHARRKFHKVIKAKSNPKKKGLADEAIGYIRRLYRFEKHADENVCLEKLVLSQAAIFNWYN